MLNFFEDLLMQKENIVEKMRHQPPNCHKYSRKRHPYSSHSDSTDGSSSKSRNDKKWEITLIFVLVCCFINIFWQLVISNKEFWKFCYRHLISENKMNISNLVLYNNLLLRLSQLGFRVRQCHNNRLVNIF